MELGKPLDGLLIAPTEVDLVRGRFLESDSVTAVLDDGVRVTMIVFASSFAERRLPASSTVDKANLNRITDLARLDRDRSGFNGGSTHCRPR